MAAQRRFVAQVPLEDFKVFKFGDIYEVGILAVPAAPWWQQLAGLRQEQVHLSQTGPFSFNQMDIRSSQKVLHKTGADAPFLKFPAAILSKHYKKNTPSYV